jgi:hypothetical protein
MTRWILQLAIVLYLLFPPLATADPITASIGAIVAISGAAVAAYGTGAIIATAIASALISTGLGLLASSLQPKPKIPTSVDDRQRSVTENFTGTTEYVPIAYGTMRLGANRVYVASQGGKLHYVLIFSEGPIQGFDEILIDGTPSTDPKFNSLINIYPFYGTDTQRLDATFIANAPGITEDHRFTGFAGLAMTFNKSDVFTRFPVVTAIVKGRKVFDPRTNTTAWSDNPALVLRDYLTNTRYGCAIPASELDDPSFINLANYCDEVPDTEKRYRFNGFVPSGETRLNNIQQMQTAFNGIFFFAQGKFYAKSLRHELSVGHVDEDVLLGYPSITVAGRTEKFNGVDAKYVNPANEWQPDLLLVRDEVFLKEDGNLPSIVQLDLPYTTSTNMAKRLAQLAMRQTRLKRVVSFQMDFSGVKYAIGDVITLSYSLMNWVDVPLRIMGITLNPDATVTITCQDYDDDVYQEPGIGDGILGGVVGLPLPNEVLPPSPVNLTETLLETGAAGVQSQITLSWLESESLFIAHYEVQYRSKGTTEWSTFGIRKYPPMTLTGFSAGTYEYRIQAINSLGYASTWAYSNHTLYGLLTPPADVTGLMLTPQRDVAVLSWNIHPDIDVRSGGRVHVHHSNDVFSASWGGSRLMDVIAGNSTQATLPLMPGTYMLKAEDTTGNFSETEATLVNAISPADLGHSLVATLETAPSFAGSKSNFSVVSNGLESTATPATYTVATAMNLGALLTVRLDSELSFNTSVANNNIDGPELWDGSELVDGNSPEPITLTAEVRLSETNPSSSPTWGEWHPLTAGTYRFWGAQFRLKANSTDMAIQTRIETFTLRAYTY